MNSQKLSVWSLTHAILLTIVGTWQWYMGDSWGIYIAGLLSFSILIIVSYPEWIMLKPIGGYANHLTLIRLLLLLATLFVNNPYLVFGLLLLSIVLDAFDGWLARKFSTISEFGSFFDIEMDAFFMLVLTSSIYQLNLAPGWVLHAGLVRYYYIILKYVLGWNQKKEPRINATRYVAIAVFVFHFAPFITPAEFHIPLLILGSGLLYLSFAYSFFRLAILKD